MCSRGWQKPVKPHQFERVRCQRSHFIYVLRTR